MCVAGSAVWSILNKPRSNCITAARLSGYDWTAGKPEVMRKLKCDCIGASRPASREVPQKSHSRTCRDDVARPVISTVSTIPQHTPQLIATLVFCSIRKQSSSRRCSARMNAWLLSLPDRLATSSGRLHLLQVFWSAQEAPLVVLAIDTRETYRFLNSAIDSSVTRILVCALNGRG